MTMTADAYSQFATVRESLPSGEMLHVYGDIDLVNAPLFASAIDDVAKGDRTILINLAACRYLDSSGLSVLVWARKQHGPRVRVLVREASAVYRVLRVTNLHRVFTIEPVDGIRAVS